MTSPQKLQYNSNRSRNIAKSSDAPARCLVPNRRPWHLVRRRILRVGRPDVEDDARRTVRVRARELDACGQGVRAVASDGDLCAAGVVLRAADGVLAVGDVGLVEGDDFGCEGGCGEWE